MLARIPAGALALLSLSVLAAATPTPNNPPPPPPGKTVTVTVTATAPTTTVTSPSGTCTSSAPVQCCAATEKADSPTGSLILGLLGIVVQGLDVVLGIDCSPITVIGIGSGDCSGTTVCCEDNSVGGLISIGCIPIVL